MSTKEGCRLDFGCIWVEFTCVTDLNLNSKRAAGVYLEKRPTCHLQQANLIDFGTLRQEPLEMLSLYSPQMIFLYRYDLCRPDDPRCDPLGDPL